LIKSEVKFGSSRFDFYIEAGERKIFIEIKGVTLEEDGVALFPDAPTERGTASAGIGPMCGGGLRGPCSVRGTNERCALFHAER
jgi:hypothetical protein